MVELYLTQVRSPLTPPPRSLLVAGLMVNLQAATMAG